MPALLSLNPSSTSHCKGQLHSLPPLGAGKTEELMQVQCNHTILA